MFELNKLKDALKISDVEHCVYELYHGEDVIYVGSTKKLRSRITAHSAEKKGMFTHVKYVQCAPSEMLALEAETIFKLKPLLNYTMPNNQKYVIKSAAIKEMKEYIADSMESVCDGFLSVNESGGHYVYVDVDKQAELLSRIDDLISSFSGCNSKVPSILNSISLFEVNKPGEKYSYNYAGAIDGEVVTEVFDSKEKAEKAAYREAVSRNIEHFSTVICNDHKIALLINQAIKKEQS